MKTLERQDLEMKSNLLLTPGPTYIPPDICEVLGRPIIHHRTPQFQGYLKEVEEGLRYVFQTKNDVYLLAASGTGAMEAAVCNLLSSGDQAITVEGGKFGERWTELCQAYGAKPNVIEVPWGTAIKAEQIEEALNQNKDIKAVFVTLCETSTGVTPDIKAIGEVVKKTDAVLVVDAVSGLGSSDLQMDNWSVDVVVSGSHKGFMLPPGLAFIALSSKAFQLVEACQSPRYYFDLRKSKAAWEKTDTPFTPAINIVIGMTESLKFYKDKGIENLFAHYEKLAKGVRAAAKAIGLSLLADDESISNTLTAIVLPDSIDGGKLVKTMRDERGVTVAGGQGKLKGRIIRIAHMGCLTEEDMVAALECFESVLQDMGYTFNAGDGVAAAKEVFGL